jgi:hypothetical protein
MVHNTLEQRVFLYDTYVEYDLLENVGVNICVNLVIKRVPSRETIPNLVNKQRHS